MDELKKGVAKKKGRGFGDAGGEKRTVKQYDTLDDDGQGGPQRSVEVCYCLLNFIFKH